MMVVLYAIQNLCVGNQPPVEPPPPPPRLRWGGWSGEGAAAWVLGEALYERKAL